MQTLEALKQICQSTGNRQTGTESEKTPTCRKSGKRAHVGAANAPQLGYRGQLKKKPHSEPNGLHDNGLKEQQFDLLEKFTSDTNHQSSRWCIVTQPRMADFGRSAALTDWSKSAFLACPHTC